MISTLEDIVGSATILVADMESSLLKVTSDDTLMNLDNISEDSQ